MSDETCDWKYATNRLGVSRKTLYAMVGRHELFGERQGTGATAPWVFRKADVDALAERREHDRRMRESGRIGFGATSGGGYVMPDASAVLLEAYERQTAVSMALSDALMDLLPELSNDGRALVVVALRLAVAQTKAVEDMLNADA